MDRNPFASMQAIQPPTGARPVRLEIRLDYDPVGARDINLRAEAERRIRHQIARKYPGRTLVSLTFVRQWDAEDFDPRPRAHRHRTRITRFDAVFTDDMVAVAQ